MLVRALANIAMLVVPGDACYFVTPEQGFYSVPDPGDPESWVRSKTIVRMAGWVMRQRIARCKPLNAPRRTSEINRSGEWSTRARTAPWKPNAAMTL